MSGLLAKVQVHRLGMGVRSAELDWKSPYFWDGKLDETAVFNDTLSAEQIRKLANFVPR
jgi:hypothetical protein